MTAIGTRIAALVLLGLVLVLSPAALAGKGGNGGKASGGSSSSSLTLVVLDPDDGGANYGEQVTFNVSTSVVERYVYVSCSQNGTVVYTGSAGFYAGYLWPWQQTFTLLSDVWTGGAADCSARLYYFDGRRTRDLASLSFRVGA
jgi:hypothetical protein